MTSKDSQYNTFSDRESEQQHRTMTFAELPNYPLLQTMRTPTSSGTIHEVDEKYVIALGIEMSFVSLYELMRVLNKCMPFTDLHCKITV